MKYFLIGDEVYVPKHKMIGTITDKLFEAGNDEILLRIYPKDKLTDIAYGNSTNSYPRWVNYSTVRSLKTNELYQKKIETLPNIDELDIPNLLKKKDIIKGTKVKIVDNYMLERMMSYTYIRGNILYNRLELSYIVDKDAILTGKSLVLQNGVMAVECKFWSNTYYIYQHSIQLVKKVNIFRRVWSKIRKIDYRVWLFLFSSITIFATALCIGILKARGH